MPVTITVTITVNIVLIVTGRIGLDAILTVKVPVTIGTIIMLKFDGDCDSVAHRVGMHHLSYTQRPFIVSKFALVKHTNTCDSIKKTRTLNFTNLHKNT